MVVLSSRWLIVQPSCFLWKENFIMDSTQRKITKIAREVSKFTVQTMKEEGIGSAEFDVIQEQSF